MTPAYTVVIPAYNAAAFIAEGLRSVLAQTLPPERIVVVDDGSTDGTADAVASVAGNITYVRQDNAGPGSATTKGMLLVRTNFIATLDADDLWVPNKIERQFTAVTPEIAAVFTRIANFRGEPANVDRAGAYDGWVRSTMLIRTEAALATGAVIDPPGAGDMVDWIARVREGGQRLILLPELLVLRRVHPASLTAKGSANLAAGYLSVARAALQRRRAAAGHEGDDK